MNESFNFENDEQNNEKKLNKWEIIGITITLIALIVAFFYVFAIKPKKDLQGADKQALVSPTARFTSSVNKNAVTLNVKFSYLDKKTYYYKTLKLENDKQTKDYGCTKVDTKNSVQYKFTQTTTPTYFYVTTYSDSKCTAKEKTFKSDTFKAKATSSNTGGNNSSTSSTSAPTITMTPESGKINSKGIVEVTSANDYKVKIVLSNTKGKTYYYRWFTYASQNISSTPSFRDTSCTSFNSKKERTPGLSISTAYPQRAGQVKVYSSEASCLADSKSTSSTNVVVTKTIKYTLTNVLNIITTPAVKATSGISTVTKEGNYKTTFRLNNTTGKTYYYRWFAYKNHDTSKDASYTEKNCVSFSNTLTTSPGLKIDFLNYKRAGQIKVYSSSSACNKDTKGKSNEGVVAKSVVKYSLAKVFNNTNGYKQLNINAKSVWDTIGHQPANNNKCFSYAMSYGLYILSNGTKTGSKTQTNPSYFDYGSYKVQTLYPSAKDMWAKIQEKINSGIPLIIHVRHSGNEHWVTIYGYNTKVNKNSVKYSDILKNVNIIDPYSGVFSSGKLSPTATTIHSNHAVRTWG